MVLIDGNNQSLALFFGGVDVVRMGRYCSNGSMGVYVPCSTVLDGLIVKIKTGCVPDLV